LLHNFRFVEYRIFFFLNTFIFPPTSLEAATPISPTSYTPEEENYDKGGQYIKVNLKQTQHECVWAGFK